VKGGYISVKSTFESNEYRTPFSHAEYPGTKKPKGKSSAKWMPLSEAFNVRNLEVPNGLVYLGKNLESVDRYYVEPSLIDPSLKVDFKSPDWEGDDMGYFPSYSEISPKCRGAYLTWVSEGRRNPEIGVGYIFIFFYGLERRVLHDECENEELQEIVEEVTALLKCYGSKSRSIKQYFANFLSFVAVQYGADFHSSSLGEGELYARYFTPLFLQQLGTTVKQGDPISKELALVWVKQHPDIRLPTPARRCPSEFHVLFLHHYQEIYGEGFLVKENKTRLDLSYRPSSAGIYQIHKKIDLPDPSQLSGPLKKLMKVVDVCVAELDPYSRFLGRKGDSESIVNWHAKLTHLGV
jgi:hypothetical protein